jgi:hypothetical protein
MAIQHLEPRQNIARIQDAIAQQVVTIKELKEGGHITSDAERHLQDLKESLALLR